jgi:hypothetical protein
LHRAHFPAVQVGNESADNEESVRGGGFHGLHSTRRSF